MADKKNRPKSPPKLQSQPLDSIFILKIVVFLLLGSLWLRVYPDGQTQLPLPLGAFLGLAIARHEHFQIDRRIEYVVLLLAMFVGFWLPIGFDVRFN